MTLEELEQNFRQKISLVKTEDDIKNIRLEFLSKKSELNNLAKNIAGLSDEEKRTAGAKINALKQLIADAVENKEKEIKQELANQKLQSEYLDITLPVRDGEMGLIHPISKVLRELEQIFYSMGFTITDGPEIEDDWTCFEALNIPPDHPARQMQDTFYMPDDKGKKMVLRTHTTTMEMREISRHEPPLKFITTGKTYRCDMDATHSPMFHQLDAAYVDKNITLQDLKDCLTTLCKKFFNLNDVPLRFRPSFFPFTSPSIEVDIRCQRKNGTIVVGKGDQWLEVLGAGMLHPNVLRNAKVDPDKYQGFACGIGIERMAMLKYNMGDIRSLYDADLRFLRKYGFRIFE